MIVRILSEGQWRIDGDAHTALNALDDAVEAAVQAGDQAQLGQALQRLHDQVRAVGVVVPDEEISGLRSDPARRGRLARRGARAAQ